MQGCDGYVIQLLLPVRDNAGKVFPDRIWSELKNTLTARFGGVTAYTRAPAEGVWKPSPERIAAEDVFIVEVMSQRLDCDWWRSLRSALEARLGQEQIIVRALPYVAP
jgi:hypothetical protein